MVQMLKGQLIKDAHPPGKWNPPTKREGERERGGGEHNWLRNKNIAQCKDFDYYFFYATS